MNPGTTAADDAAPGMGMGTARRITVRSPSTGAVVGEVPLLDASEVLETVARARAAQSDWARRTVSDRADCVMAMAHAMVSRADELVDAVTLETARPRMEVLAREVFSAVDSAYHGARTAERVLADRGVPLHLHRHRTASTRPVALGVVGVIAPWNQPLAWPVEVLVAALLAGNGVVLKPSSRTPLTALKLREIAESAGIPGGLLGVATGGGSTGAALVEAAPQRLVFSGRADTARTIGAACATRLIPCTLSLPGRGLLIACSDCDVESAARAAVYGAFVQAGQAQGSVDRVLAHASVHDALQSRIVAWTESLRVGDGARPDVDMGALMGGDAVDRVEGYVRAARSHGATVATGGRRMEGPGAFFEPTVLVGAAHALTALSEGPRGPVLSMVSVPDHDHAVSAVRTVQGLSTAAVFSRSAARARRVGEALPAALVTVNDVAPVVTVAEIPWAGVGSMTGHGTALGTDALRAMARECTVLEDRLPTPTGPLWFPYSATRYAAVKSAMSLMLGRHGFMGRVRDLF